MQPADHYATLGLSPSATAEEVRAAYYRLARAWHPDRHPGDATASARMVALNQAYEVLSDPARRLEYDRSLQPTPMGIFLSVLRDPAFPSAFGRVIDMIKDLLPIEPEAREEMGL